MSILRQNGNPGQNWNRRRSLFWVKKRVINGFIALEMKSVKMSKRWILQKSKKFTFKGELKPF
jgi:hypothetical protein